MAGTGNALWMLIMAIVKTEADYSGRYVCLAFLNNVAHSWVKRKQMSEGGAAAQGQTQWRKRITEGKYTRLQLQQGHRAKFTTPGSNCCKAAVRHSHITSKTGRNTKGSHYLVKKELSVIWDTIMLRCQEMPDTCYPMCKKRIIRIIIQMETPSIHSIYVIIHPGIKTLRHIYVIWDISEMQEYDWNIFQFLSACL